MEQTLLDIQESMDRLGDLPVFSASVNKICNVSADPDADAMSLTNEILKDANLSVKLLRLANSTHFNPGSGKINVISRAVVLLGFETVMNLSLTMKLIDSFQHQHPSIDMDKLLVQAYISAGFVRDLSIKIGVKDAEATYTCALLHELGKIAIAYFLPNKYIEIEALNKEGLLSPQDNETAILGASISSIGKQLATSWEFSPSVVATMDHTTPKITGQITKPVELNKTLANLGSKIVGSLYSDCDAGELDLQEMMTDLAKATGVTSSALETSLSNSFRKSCELAQEYGLPRKKLMPAVAASGDPKRDKLASQFSFFAQNLPNTDDAIDTPPIASVESTEAQTILTKPIEQHINNNAEHQPQPAEKSNTDTFAATADRVDPMLQLQYIQDITALITDSAKLNVVLVKVLEGMLNAIGFTRVVLCLLSGDRKTYVGRIAIGTDKDLMKEFFNKKIDPEHDIFSRVLMEGVDVFVEDSHDQRWQNVLPPKYMSSIGSNAFVTAALRSGVKPLGLIYADKGSSNQPISQNQQRGFIQFVAQARLALQTCR